MKQLEQTVVNSVNFFQDVTLLSNLLKIVSVALHYLQTKFSPELK